MNFTPVDYLPERRYTTYKKVGAYLQEFMKMNVKTARVDYTPEEYTSAQCVSTPFRYAINADGYPIKVQIINGDVYLTRTDM